MQDFDFNDFAEIDTFDLYMDHPASIESDDMFDDDDSFSKTMWDGSKFVSPDTWALNAVS